jgi:hypothetical protein
MSNAVSGPSSQGSIPEELVLWEGGPIILSVFGKVSIVLSGFLLLAFTLPVILIQETALEGSLPIPIALLILNVFFVLVAKGTRYYITTQRVLLTRLVPFLKRKEILWLSEIAEVRTKRTFGTKLLEFKTSERKTLTFRMLDDDPEKVRRAALDALDKVRLNPSATA